MSNTTTNAVKLTEEQAAGIINQIVNLDAEISKLTEARKNLAATLTASVDPGTYQAGAVKATITVPKRFNEKEFTKQFPPSTNPEFYKTVQKIDLTTIAPNTKAEFSDLQAPRLTIK